MGEFSPANCLITRGMPTGTGRRKLRQILGWLLDYVKLGNVTATYRDPKGGTGSMLDCWSIGRTIDPAPGEWFITTVISLAQVIPIPV